LTLDADPHGCYRATTGLAYDWASRLKPAKLARNLLLRGKVKQDLKNEVLTPNGSPDGCAWSSPDDPEMWVSTETIYQSLSVQSCGALRRELTRCLRTGRALRRPSRKPGQRRNRIPNMININERPPKVADRAVPGHWEGDRATWKVARGEWIMPFGDSIGEGVTRFSVNRVVPSLACVMGDCGVRSPGKKPKPFSFHPGWRARGRPDVATRCCTS
jgi:IS30 family transposase